MHRHIHKYGHTTYGYFVISYVILFQAYYILIGNFVADETIIFTSSKELFFLMRITQWVMH